MRKRYLLTGAAGHLGATILRKLCSEGEEVRALVLPGEERALPDGVPRVVGDVRDEASLLPLFASGEDRETVLLHCAALVTIASKDDPAVWDVNVSGTQTLLRLARRFGVGRVVYVSTVHAIPEKPAPQVMAEVSQFDPALVCGQYAKSKAAASQQVLEAAAAGLHASVVHPSGIIGPGDAAGRNHTVRTVCGMASGRIPASLQGGYDFVDVRDVAEGILQCAAQGRSGECYLLTGEYVTIRQLLTMACEAAGRRPSPLEVPGALAAAIAPAAERLSLLLGGGAPLITPCSVRTMRGNGRFTHEKATRELGYRPRPIRESIRDTLACAGLCPL